MAIDFIINDKVVVNQTYVNLSLGTVNTSTAKIAAITLGNMGDAVLNVAATGTLEGKSYIRLVPINNLHFQYRNGSGVIVYFDSDVQLNNSLELSNAFFGDYIAEKVYNDTVSTLTKGSAVYQTGFDTTVQLPTVDFASAAASPTAHFFGFLEEDIAPAASGSCLVGGSLIADTASMAVNDLIYLSDTPGEFGSSSGSVSVIIGRVTTVGTEGSIQISGEVASQGSGGGGGSQGTTGIRGNTGIQGTTGILGLQGTTGLAGIQGTTGIQGLQGDNGTPGSQGVTGLYGQTGLLGLTGLIGATGPGGGAPGQTGIQGATGVGAGEGGGATGIQGVTGIGGGSSASSVRVLATITDIDPVAGATQIAMYSVPSSTKTIITNMSLRLDAANTISTTVTAAGGFNGTANNVFPPVQTTAVTATNDSWAFAAQGKVLVGTAGQTFLIGVTGLVGTTALFSADVIGYEVAV